MIFILHEVKLWFKDEKAEPRTYDFIPNKINVITGDATTGKTSFWRIIDYCLLSGKVNIADPINEKVSWYGIRFTINDKEISIARKSSDKGAISSEVYFNFGKLPTEPIQNEQIAEIKAKLDLEFGITDALRFPHGKEFGKTSFNLSFRHFLLFNSLTEDIIGNSSSYLDTSFYGKQEYDNALKHIFDMVIGVNDMENIKAEERIKKIDSEIKKIQAKEKKKVGEEKGFETDIFKLITRLKENALTEYLQPVDNAEDALNTIKDVITTTQKEASNTRLFAEIDNLNQSKLEVKTQISAIEKYQKEFDHYKKNLNKSADSLKPIDFLNKNLSDQLIESYETKKFIDSLEASLKAIQSSISPKAIEPIKISGDVISLQTQLKDIDNRLVQLSLIRQKYQNQAEKFIVLGEIKNTYEQLIKKDKIAPIDTVKLNQLNEEKANLQKNSSDTEQVKFTMKTELNKSIQRNYDLLSSLPAYKGYETKFNETDMILQLQQPNQLFPLDNIGSKSNYMMLHLCFFLGLHEHMISVGQTHVPQFLFIDQPSIPYYSGNEAKGNDDKTKLLDAFSLINSFISYINKEHGKNFQIFMVEHAPKEYWSDSGLTQFHTVDEFINGKGLIPNYNN